jgi:hypothetical protein
VRFTAGVEPGPPALIAATKPSPHAVSWTSQVPKARFRRNASGVVGRSFDGEEQRARPADDVGVAGAVDRDRAGGIVELAVEVRRVDEAGPARRDLRDERVGAPGDAVPPAGVLLDHAGRGREVRRVRLARHVGVAGPVDGNGVDHRTPRATEVRRVAQPRAVGVELRDEPGKADDAAAPRQLDRIDEREVARRRRARDVRVAGRVDRDARGHVVALAAEEGRVDERAPIDGQLGDEAVAREGVDVGARGPPVRLLRRREVRRDGGAGHVRVALGIHRDTGAVRRVEEAPAEARRVDEVPVRIELRDQHAGRRGAEAPAVHLAGDVGVAGDVDRDGVRVVLAGAPEIRGIEDVAAGRELGHEEVRVPGQRARRAGRGGKVGRARRAGDVDVPRPIPREEDLAVEIRLGLVAGAAEIRRVRDDRVDDEPAGPVVGAQPEPDAPPGVERVVDGHRPADAADPLVRDRSWLAHVAGGGVDDERALAVHLDAVGAVDAEADPARIRARRDHEVVLEPARPAVVHEVDAGVGVPVAHAAIRRRADGPLEPAARKVADGPRKPPAAGHPRRGGHADRLQAEKDAAVAEREHGLGRRQEGGVAPTARDEPYRRVELAAVRLEDRRAPSCRRGRRWAGAHRRAGQLEARQHRRKADQPRPHAHSRHGDSSGQNA